MKLQPDIADTTIITGYSAGWVSVGFFVNGQPQQEKLTHSFMIGSQGERLDWPGIRFDQLTAEHFEQLANFKPELVIFGSGSKLRFPSPVNQRALMQARIGLETMDTLAACRTYNILAGEGRHVLAVLLAD
ncbi:MAG: Xcc1710-like domain-containing protein [Brachymonas sp.]|nr:Xcc1710-like domain-containing protein [Brachymonas sp.]